MHLMTSVPASDWMTGIVLFGGLTLLLTVAELLYKKYGIAKENIRKLVHISSGIAVMSTPLLFNTAIPLLLISSLFTALNLYSVLKAKLNSYNATSRKSLGTVYFPVIVIVLTVLFWHSDTNLFYTTIALLTFADAAAGIFGKNAPKQSKLPLPWDVKSQRGAVAMFVTSIIVIATLFHFSSNYNRIETHSLILATLAIALLVTAAELLSYRGSDNLTVPAIAALALLIFRQTDLQTQFISAAIMAVLIASLAFKFRALDLSGALATFILGTLIFSAGGWLYTAPILIFFIASSALSHVPNSKKHAVDEIIESGARRNVTQVFANGMAPLVCVLTDLFNPDAHFFLFYLGALAAATADTWATEIGLFSHARPRSIISWQKTEAGISGGITILGSVGAIAGAALVTISGYMISHYFRQNAMAVQEIILITAAGFFAQVIDSLLGAKWQRKNRCCVCGKITERRHHCEAATILESGKRWMNNDGVNLICGFSGIFFVILSCQFLNI